MSASPVTKTAQTTAAAVAVAATAPIVTAAPAAAAAAAVAQTALAAAPAASPAAPVSLKERVTRIIISLGKKEIAAAHAQLEACKEHLTRAEWRPIADCIKKNSAETLQRLISLIKIFTNNPAIKDKDALKMWLQPKKEEAAKSTEAPRESTQLPSPQSGFLTISERNALWLDGVDDATIKYIVDKGLGPYRDAPLLAHMCNQLMLFFIKLEHERALEGNLEKSCEFIQKWTVAQKHFNDTVSLQKMRDVIKEYIQLYQSETTQRLKAKLPSSIVAFIQILDLLQGGMQLAESQAMSAFILTKLTPALFLDGMCNQSSKFQKELQGRKAR